MIQEAQPGARVERDSMGPMEVPAGAYYGASTQRAVLNFPISKLRFERSFISAIGLIKLAAAEVNRDLGLLDPKLAEAIIAASREVADGRFDDQFVLDIFQTGSGTSTNMNANEVIATRAIQLLGADFGSRLVHPNDHINICQSSNDVIPTAIHLAALIELRRLLPAVEKLEAAMRRKAEEFWPIVKTGRTHLQDATPIRLGQVFLGYAGQAERMRRWLGHARAELSEVALGGTAVGTGINAHPEFAERVCRRVSELAGVEIHETGNHFQAQNTLDNIVESSGALKTVAVSLLKIANDLRWMSAGPRAGIGEIELPAVQPGSSIMPGKINPVIAESLLMVCAQVMGNHTTATVAGQSGNFEINVMMPVAAYNLLQSIELLATSIDNLVEQCVDGIKATATGPEMVERGLMLTTALAPIVGYDAAAALAKEAAATGRTIRELAREKTNISPTELEQALDPLAMTEPGLGKGGGGG